MKKFTKGCLIAALSMLAVGIVMLTISFFLGGASLFSYLQDETGIHPDRTFHHPEDAQTVPASDITDLTIELGTADCIISESSDEYFHIYAKDAPKFQCYVEDSALYIKKTGDISLHPHRSNRGIIYLESPKDFSFRNIELLLGACVINVPKLTASDKINIVIGAGELMIDALSADTLTIEVGVGNAEIENASVKSCNMEVGLGSMTYSGSVIGNLSAECGMGNMELYLNDTYESHNYEIESAMGNITLNNKSYAAVAGTNSIQHGTDSTYVLECAMGSMTISFQ